MSQPNEYIGGKRFGLGFKIKAVIAVFTLLLGAVSVLSFFTLQRFNDQLTEYSEKTLPELASSIELNSSLERVVQNAEQLVSSRVQAQRRIAYTSTQNALSTIETLLESKEVLGNYEEIQTVLSILADITAELNRLIENRIDLAAQLETQRAELGRWVVSDLVGEANLPVAAENAAYSEWLEREHALVERVVTLATSNDFSVQQRQVLSIQRGLRALFAATRQLPDPYQQVATSRLEGLQAQLSSESGLSTKFREWSQVNVRAYSLERQMRVNVAELLRNTDQLASERSTQAQATAGLMAQQSEQQLAVLAASVFFAIAIAVFSFFYIERRMLARFAALRHAVISRASGGSDALPELGDDEIGEISAAVQHFIDEIDRRQAQVLESAEQMNAIVRLSPQAMCIADGDTILYYNEAFADLWLDPDDGVQANEQTILSLFPKRLTSSDGAEGNRHVARHAIQGRSGNTRWFSMASSPVEWHGQNARQIIAVDTSKQVQVEHTLEEARRRAEAAAQAKTNFLAMMSHEIRSPMNGIISVGEMLGDSKLNKEQDQLVKVINQSAETLLTILDDVLDLSKIEAGKLEINPHQFDLHATLNGATDLLRQSAQQKHLSLNLDLDDSLPRHVVGDSNRIRQIMYNLLSNALKFTEAGGVTISASAEKRDQGQFFVRMSVTDTGIGINPETLSRLFQPFEQADSSVARQYGGTGLGLSICRRLAHLMDGEISVVSKENEGSTFSFELMLDQAPDAAATQGTNGASPARSDSDKARILVVEDNKVNQLVIGKILKSLGYEWDTADDGKNALSLYDPSKHGIVLTDLRMPNMDGFALASAIRQGEKDGVRVPIIAISADAMEEAKERSIESGIDHFLTKPVRVEDVRSCLEAIS
ncbi:MAG: response regulator [Kordiimonadaceae bacterium]|nr:response regulator [Kordiimonadaceae bacterium]MBO6568866.1 response regulator [Kordiimonadaceae bacterium]MBO6965159.1 response regulator [Kordiimonadaceae bacterium]